MSSECSCILCNRQHNLSCRNCFLCKLDNNSDSRLDNDTGDLIENQYYTPLEFCNILKKL